MTGFRLTSPTLAGHVLTSDATGNGLWQPPALGNDWRLGGNAGTNPATDFLGTTDNAALELRVNNVRALRLEPNAESPNVVGGFNGNTVTSGVAGAVIGGGGAASPYFNRVTDGYGVVGGGAQNRAGNDNGDPLDARFATVGGGFVNTASGDRSTVGGGDFNRAAGPYSTTGGGYDNAASGEYSTIAGGSNNRAIGDYSTVAGGISNRAGGSYSFAAGLGARVRDAAQSGDLDGDENTFVWGGGGGVFTSTGPNQFLIRSVGGVGINKNNPAAGALDVNGNVLSSGDVISTGLVRTAGGVAISAGASPAGQLQMGEPANFSAFRFGGSSARHHLISNRDMVFNTYDLDGVVNGQPLYYWRRNPTQFDENAAPVTLMTLADDGSLSVTGTLSKGGGSFKIDHPLDPENKFLYHSFVESPDMMNIYNGLVTTNAEGLAVVEMPTWFEALNRDFRYQLTVIGDGAWARARVFKRIACGRFTIQTDLPNVEVSWQVTGIRQDAFAEQNRIPVEQDKPANQRGTLLYPGAASNR
jgi:hypothetical protein